MSGRIVGCGKPRATRDVLDEIEGERLAQDAKWGQQNHPDGTADVEFRRNQREQRRRLCDLRFSEGKGTWRDILLEEVYEAMAEEDHAALRAELIQVAAVAVAWVEAIDRRGSAQ